MAAMIGQASFRMVLDLAASGTRNVSRRFLIATAGYLCCLGKASVVSSLLLTTAPLCTILPVRGSAAGTKIAVDRINVVHHNGSPFVGLVLYRLA
jgi:hypothetical protein